MTQREPATRHLCAEELREQLQMLDEERKTTFYRRRAPLDAARSISGPSERTVTMFDAGIEALAGEPCLGRGSVEEPGVRPQQAGHKVPIRRRTISDTYRLPRFGKAGPLVGGAVVLLGLAILAAAIAWKSSARVSAERVPPPPSVANQPAPLPTEGREATVTTVPAHSAPRPQPPPSAPPSAPPAVAKAATQSAAMSARQAVDLLLAGRTRDALDAYRALAAAPGSSGELAVVVSLLEHELRACAQGKETERCAH